MREVIVSSSVGFCCGVECAFRRVCRVRESTNGRVCLLGQLVHNQQVNDELIRKHIEIIDHDDELDTLTDVDTVVISAHGVSPSRRQMLEKYPFHVIDCTCTHVKKIAQIIKNNYYRHVIFLGDHVHAEVDGLIGYAKNSCICSNIHELHDFLINFLKKDTAYIVLCQSTLDIDFAVHAENLVNLYKYSYDICFENTICRATYMRQNALNELIDCDAIVLIGSKNSANARRLYERICAKNKVCYWIDSVSDINDFDFMHVDRLGITSAASTSMDDVDSVRLYFLEKFSCK